MNKYWDKYIYNLEHLALVSSLLSFIYVCIGLAACLLLLCVYLSSFVVVGYCCLTKGVLGKGFESSDIQTRP